MFSDIDSILSAENPIPLFATEYNCADLLLPHPHRANIIHNANNRDIAFLIFFSSKIKSAQPKPRTEKRTASLAATQVSDQPQWMRNRGCVFTEEKRIHAAGYINLCRNTIITSLCSLCKKYFKLKADQMMAVVHMRLIYGTFLLIVYYKVPYIAITIPSDVNVPYSTTVSQLSSLYAAKHRASCSVVFFSSASGGRSSREKYALSVVSEFS